jgi:hypothetical protein
MKKLPFILSVISLVGVITLAILFFFKNEGSSSDDKNTKGQGQADLKIAYILTDSVLVNYHLAIDLQKDFYKSATTIQC